MKIKQLNTNITRIPKPKPTTHPHHPSLTDLLFGHPRVGLLRVAVEQLQVHALLVEDAPLLPELEQLHLLLGEHLQLLLDLGDRLVTGVQQTLAGLDRAAETVLPRVNLTLGGGGGGAFSLGRLESRSG